MSVTPSWDCEYRDTDLLVRVMAGLTCGEPIRDFAAVVLDVSLESILEHIVLSWNTEEYVKKLGVR